MKSKIVYLSFFFIVLVPTTRQLKAQSFMHGYGATIGLLFGNDEFKNNITVMTTNATYMPRLVFGGNERSSFSLGAPVSAGIGLAQDFFGGTSLYYGGDIPVVFDYNHGRKSSRENEDRFGWYVGTGFSYTLTYFSDSDENLNSYGPLIRAGIRFGAGSKNPDRATTIGFSFKPGLEKTKYKTFGIAVLTEL